MCQIQDRYLSATEEICLPRVFARGNTAIALIHFLWPEDAAHAARTSPMKNKLIIMGKKYGICTSCLSLFDTEIDSPRISLKFV